SGLDSTHERGTVSRRLDADDPRAEALRDRRGIIRAAVVCDDDLTADAVLAKRAHGALHASADRLLLVLARDDDGQLDLLLGPIRRRIREPRRCCDYRGQSVPSSEP